MRQSLTASSKVGLGDKTRHIVRDWCAKKAHNMNLCVCICQPLCCEGGHELCLPPEAAEIHALVYIHRAGVCISFSLCSSLTLTLTLPLQCSSRSPRLAAKAIKKVQKRRRREIGEGPGGISKVRGDKGLCASSPSYSVCLISLCSSEVSPASMLFLRDPSHVASPS